MIKSNKSTARLAGLLYLIVVLTGIFYLMYVPSKLIVWEDASITVKNITNSELLFRLGIFSGLICYLAFLLLPLVLYKLLNPVHKDYAFLMVVFAVVSVPIAFVNFGNEFSVLTLLDNGAVIHGVELEKLQQQVLFNLQSYRNGNRIISIFSGLWLLPFGYLVFKSGFLPKILGVSLMLGCVGYLINFAGILLLTNYSNSAIAEFITIPASIGEIGICLWLLIAGVKKNKSLLSNTNE